MADEMGPPAPRSEHPPPELRRTPSIPTLRQRQLHRAATVAEAVRPRRRSSLFSLSSLDDVRPSATSSTDNLLRSTHVEPLASDETTHWHSVPLVFAILPAVAGLLFNNGSAIVTDLLLLGISTMFLNWCIRIPWDWYNSAQHVRVISEDHSDERSSTIFEEESEAGEEDNAKPTGSDPEESPDPERDETLQTAEQEEASAELRRKELSALAACFISPVLGAYLLHYIRSSLSRPSEGLVSNYNLTIFVLAAELRPFSHMIKLQRARILHLQRVVQRDAGSAGSNGPHVADKAALNDLAQRIEHVETQVTRQTTRDGLGSSRTDARAVELGNAAVRQTLQPQLDALNRAVRRYEKRYTTQTIQTEARLHDLESRLRDALALAAAAARTGQKPGIIAGLLEWTGSFFAFWLRGVWAIVVYPFLVMGDFTRAVRRWLLPASKAGTFEKRNPGPGKGNIARSGAAAGRIHSRGPR